MEDTLSQLIALVLPAVAIIAVFTFVAVVAWSENRRKERESYYRSETFRKAMEQSGDSSRQVLDMMREEEAQLERRRVEGMRLGGMITGVAGIGVMVLIRGLIPDEQIYLAGLIPLLIGVVLTGYGFTRKL